MAKANVAWSFEIEGIGPFPSQTKASMTMSGSKAIVYGRNGAGKTSLSRMFRLAETQSRQTAADYISRGSASGSFRFSVKGKGELGLVLKLDGLDSLTNETGYLFHVFNSDYVRENLAERHFLPSGDINGYIVGKTNIEASRENSELELLLERGANLKQKIEAAIDAAKTELKGAGVSPKNQSFLSLTYENVLAAEPAENIFQEKLSQIATLNDVPDDATVPSLPAFDASPYDLDAVKELLSHSFSKAAFAEDFLRHVRPKLAFIQDGVRLDDGKTCPFCGQEYRPDAKRLIERYNQYLDDEEVKTQGRIAAQLKSMQNLYDAIASLSDRYGRACRAFDSLKKGFNQLAGQDLPEFPSLETTEEVIGRVTEDLERKTCDITQEVSGASVEKLQSLIELCEDTISSTNKLLSELSNRLSKIKSEKTRIRKELCTEALKKIRTEHEDEIASLADIRSECVSLRVMIRAKEARGRTSKREAVAELFQTLLSNLFGDKYGFDPNTFSLSLKGDELGEGADSVLSDGEKSVIAFCHFIASTKELFETEDDAGRLFFVIDDPISSMDYQHVYGVLQIIRGLDRIFSVPGSSHIRFLLLTHNTAFFNLALGNKVAKSAFVLEDGNLTKCGTWAIAPYTQHLADLKKVADGEGPTHTTGNSIRQVLESLMRFEEPKVEDLSTYLQCKRCSDLTSVPYIYTLANAGSHGVAAFDQGQPIDEDSIRRACRAVIDHVRNCYPGQLAVIDDGGVHDG